MAFFRAKVKCFVGNALREPGDEFEYNGPDNHHLERIDSEPVVDEPVPKPKRKAPAKKWTPKAARTGESSADKDSK